MTRYFIFTLYMYQCCFVFLLGATSILVCDISRCQQFVLLVRTLIIIVFGTRLLNVYNRANNRECPAQFENRIKPRMYARRFPRSTMYAKAPFC